MSLLEIANRKKRRSWFKKCLLAASALMFLFVIGVALMIFFSPYGRHDGHDYRLIKTSVLINAPADKIYDYLGDSENARKWSVFVDHIIPLNGERVPDGQEGSLRRCFENHDERGKSWDEEVIIVEPNRRRQLSCFNYVGFEMTAGDLRTEQIYEVAGDGSCLLSLTLFFPEGKDTWLNSLKMYYKSYHISDVFERNLENIKKFNE